MIDYNYKRLLSNDIIRILCVLTDDEGKRHKFQALSIRSLINDLENGNEKRQILNDYKKFAKFIKKMIRPTRNFKIMHKTQNALNDEGNNTIDKLISTEQLDKLKFSARKILIQVAKNLGMSYENILFVKLLKKMYIPG